MDKLIDSRDVTLSGASGSQAVAHALKTNGASSAADDVDVVPKADPGSAFRWWVSVSAAGTLTLNWAGGNMGAVLRVTSKLLATVVGGPSTHTGW